ncbi:MULTISPECIES: hypothetical protein [unclassified Paenibacillus]|uniref:hypothetical protein n=1 Tax=unclassified Paenibacillus TaxID=185978 RepID=UPI0004F859A9|nr:hypothetical protein [Paenibacillus sp. FSL H7-0737]AIQ22439.1 hypothetical protein H70737_06020 [Paenibacillus sp. FSL H7-0737]
MRSIFTSCLVSGKSRKKQRQGKGKTEGSVSIFLIMVLAFVFLFTAVLIDYARIAAFNVQEERLARASVRSVMSSYDVELREKYGLFAFGESDGDMLLSQVLNDNMHKSGRSDAFNLVPFALESSSLKWSRPLGSYDVVSRQILEEMKYKAPVDFALELAGKFKPMSGVMAEASRATELLSKLQPLYDEREEALDLMLEQRSLAAESGRRLLQWIMNPPAESISASSLGSMQSAADIPAQYSDYLGKYYDDLYRDSKKPAKYTYQLSLYRSRTTEMLSRLPALLTAFREDHERSMEGANKALKKAEQLNDEMRNILEQSRMEGVDLSNVPANDWDIPASSGEISSDPLKKLREQEDALILSSTDLSQMENSISMQKSSYEAIEPIVTGMSGVLYEALSEYGDSYQMISSVLEASRVVNNYLQNYGKKGSIIVSDLALIEQHRSSDKERKQLEREAKSKLGEAKALLDKIRMMGNGVTDSLKSYDTLRQYYEENIAFNKELASDPLGKSEVSTNPYTAGSSAMEDMDGIYAAMGGIMGGARDRLFQTEYSALYFQHFDVSKLATLAQGSEGTAELTDQLNPKAQELEYILYGFHNPAGNVAAAYAEIFAMRLSIRTMEGFIERASLGNPLAVLAAALLYGIQQAIQDMLLLCEKDSIPLSKYLPAQLTYRDHLRLFMMLHGGGNVQLSRMLALIRLNTGINPDERSTYVSSNIKLGMRLWFLPGVVKLLDYSAGYSGEVQGSTYMRAVQADFSY